MMKGLIELASSCCPYKQWAKSKELYLENPDTPDLGPRVRTYHLVPCLSDALGEVGIIILKI